MTANTTAFDPFASDGPREPLAVYLSKAAVFSLVLMIAGFFLLGRFSLHVDTQYRTSFPFRVWVVTDDTSIGLGDYVAFRTDERIEPFYPAGTEFVKQVVAMPGDHVVVEGRNVWVNGEWIQALYLAQYLGKPVTAFARDFIVQPGHYWVMGTSPYSFDSRYWGTLRADQIVGQSYPIW